MIMRTCRFSLTQNTLSSLITDTIVFIAQAHGFDSSLLSSIFYLSVHILKVKMLCLLLQTVLQAKTSQIPFTYALGVI